MKPDTTVTSWILTFLCVAFKAAGSVHGKAPI